MKVRFSILMPAHNRENFVRQAIDSVLSQTFTDYELLVVDDGSTDGTMEVLKSYGTRIRVIQQHNQGPEVARNKAAALARGEYLAMLDSDDILFPHALATYDRVLRDFESPPLVIGAEYSYRDGQPISAEGLVSSPVQVLKFQDYLSKTIPVIASNSMIVIQRSVFDAVGGYRNSTPQTFHNDGLHILLKVGTYGPFILVQRPYMVA